VLLNRISCGAVLAGVVVALVAHLILNMIGVGIGASTLDPGAGADQNPSALGLSIGAALGWTVSGILAALAGGFTAGRLLGQPKETSAAWLAVSPPLPAAPSRRRHPGPPPRRCHAPR
jgi:hypothetical protein